MIPTLKTTRLILKPLQLKFLSDRYLNWMQDPDITKHMESGGKNYSHHMLKDYLLKIESDRINSWAIILKSDNLHIGNIKIHPIDKKNLVGEYGIMIGDKKTWGQGFANEASIAVIKYCFKNLFLKEITLGVKRNNVSAIKLYKNLGFIENQKLYNKYNRKDYMRMILTNTKE